LRRCEALVSFNQKPKAQSEADVGVCYSFGARVPSKPVFLDVMFIGLADVPEEMATKWFRRGTMDFFVYCWREPVRNDLVHHELPVDGSF
jgi:hypothetical protein